MAVAGSQGIDWEAAEQWHDDNPGRAPHSAAIAREQAAEARRMASEERAQEQTEDGMSDADLILQMHLIHWRLRLRSPATTAEKRAWHGVMGELRRRFPGQPIN